MKKALFAIVAASSLLFAESYQVNTLSAKQLGMAHTGAGIKLGSESMHFNPGGLGFVNKKLDISAGVTFIMPEVEFRGEKGLATTTQMGTPLYVYAASSITDWLSAGLSFTSPYGNSADYGKNWEGAGLLQDISLQVFALQPTVAFKFGDISVGAGPAIYFGSFEQSKALIAPGDLNKHPQLGGTPYATKYAETSAVSATFSGDADVAVAVNVGAMYDVIPDKLTLGVAYRSEAQAKVAKGETKVNYADEADAAIFAAGLPKFEDGTFSAELPLPANLNAGVSFRPIDKLLLAFDFQMIFWGTYKELALDFTDDVTMPFVTPGGIIDVPLPKPISKKNYKDAFAYRFGAQYTVIDQLDVRLGMYFDETPVKSEYLTPESPSTNKLGSTVGLSFRPIPDLSIDAAFLYTNGGGTFGRDAKSGEKVDSNGSKDGLNGRYDVQAWVPSIGLSYNF
ncbi:MAG: outer membrane protein transport protein [Fibromonadaceae bacterium]|nr:outer membrane protein transport protein [Fibromonadaceae bacterium]